MADDTPSLEIATKFKSTWKDTPLVWRVMLIFGAGGFYISLILAPHLQPPANIAILRVALLMMAIAGIIGNKMASDDFYKTLYAEATIICAASSAVILFGLAQLGVQIGDPLIVFAFTWVLGFAVAFIRLRLR